MSFDTALPLEVGDELEIELNLPHHQKVCVAGWIVRSRPTENGQESQQSVALEYLGLGGEEEAQLLKFLDQYQLSPEAYKLTGLYPESIVQKREDQLFEIQLMGTAILGGSNGIVEKHYHQRSEFLGRLLPDRELPSGGEQRQNPSPVDFPS